MPILQMGKQRLVHGRGEQQGQGKNPGPAPQSPASHHDARESLSRVRDTSVVGTPPAILPLVSPEGRFHKPPSHRPGGATRLGFFPALYQWRTSPQKKGSCLRATSNGRHGAGLAPALGPGLWLNRAAPSAEGTHAPQAGVALGQQDIEQEGRSPVC